MYFDNPKWYQYAVYFDREEINKWWEKVSWKKKDFGRYILKFKEIKYEIDIILVLKDDNKFVKTGKLYSSI